MWRIKREFKRLVERYEYALEKCSRKIFQEVDYHIELLRPVNENAESMLNDLAEDLEICSNAIAQLSKIDCRNILVRIMVFFLKLWINHRYSKILNDMEVFYKLKGRIEKILWRLEIEKAF